MKRSGFLLFFLAIACIAQAQNSFSQDTIIVTDASSLGIEVVKKVECTSVKDQSISPTCWVFGTNSFLESELLRHYHLNINLSEMFIARYAYIDKAIQYMATGGKTYFAGGGQFHDVIRIINKYGIVPEDAYTGRVHGELLHNHARLDTAMKTFVQGLVDAGKKAPDGNDMVLMNAILDEWLGQVPATFTWNKKRYTPKTFARDVVKFNDKDYVELASFDDQSYYKKFLLDDKFNWARDSFYNVQIDDFVAIVNNAVQKGYSVGWEGDVTEPGFEMFKSIAWMPDGEHNYAEERVWNFKDESTERDHMLHLVGVAKDKNGNRWYYLKNSWGTWMNPEGGFIYMKENYFKLKTVILMVHKNTIPANIRLKLHLN